ncbi:MAG: exodeoxyribonuclease VII large subunit [Armatimonadetes bacterium]|nr:exodeoxyribonuclease VII large subunit [Armatimonadota bacterium]
MSDYELLYPKPADSEIPMSQGQILSVSDLTRCIRGVIEAEDLFRDVWIRGEVSNLTKHSSGHVYFSLKDEGALIRCVMWIKAARSIRFDLADGMGIIAHGRVSVYEKQGQYQLIADEVTPDGIGALYIAFEQLKARLDAEGLFDKAHKKAIPPFPRRIAILTSPTAAALHDMVAIARRRMPGIHLLLVPTVMQGEESVGSIVESLRLADTFPGVDVIVLGRGGGSLEDLWSFNTEPVARAVLACRTPVVSAVGHETDYTLSDLAADMRAPTPSAAMELIVPDRQELSDRIKAMVDAIVGDIAAVLACRQGVLDRLLGSPSLRYPERMLQTRWQALDMLETRLISSFYGTTSRCEGRLGEMAARLEALSPLAVLRRGYGIVRRVEDGSVVKRTSDTAVGETVETLISDGSLVSEITQIREGRM